MNHSSKTLPKPKHPYINTNPITTPNATTKPPRKLAALLVGAAAGPSNSTGEGARETPANILCL